MKTNVRSHLRRKRHGKAVVRHHKRLIRGKRRMAMRTNIEKAIIKTLKNSYPGDPEGINLRQAIAIQQAINYAIENKKDFAKKMGTAWPQELDDTIKYEDLK